MMKPTTPSIATIAHWHCTPTPVNIATTNINRLLISPKSEVSAQKVKFPCELRRRKKWSFRAGTPGPQPKAAAHQSKQTLCSSEINKLL
jgi:hypothetical protein